MSRSERSSQATIMRSCRICGGPATKSGTWCHACYKREKRKDPNYAARDRRSAVAWKDRNRERNRQRDREAGRHPCAADDCDVLVDRRSTFCRTHHVERLNSERRRTAELWAAGLSQREIAEDLGTTVASVSVKVAQMRKAGWDLPRRGPGGRILEAA